MKIKYESGVSGYIDVSHMEFYPDQAKGWLSPLFFVKHFELLRQTISAQIYIAGQDKNQHFNKNQRIFIIRQQIHFTEHLKSFLENLSEYSATKKDEALLKFIHTTAKIRNSSGIYHVEVKENGNGKTLAYGNSIVVRVNENRRPAPFSNQFRSFVENHQVSNPIFDTMEVLKVIKTVPEDARVYQWSRKLTHFDTDHNGHTNNSVYFLLPFDCLAHAIHEGVITSVPKNLNEMLIDSFAFEVAKETKEGQIMSAIVWEGLPLNFNFIMMVEDKHVAYLKLIFQSKN